MGSDNAILVTGAAGFIGFHLAQRLLDAGLPVVGLDSLNSYYDVRLKEARLELLKKHGNFRFVKLDMADRDDLHEFFTHHRFDLVLHMAAQAGVRYSLVNPHAYLTSNLVAFLNLLEECRHGGVKHLVFASSSSVYGGNTKMPFSVRDNVDHPVSLYAATKKSNELMAHSYSHLYNLPCTGLRFFTVYGPWGRPDMALFLFTKAILSGQPIDLFNFGNMKRDFTYIDDIVDGVLKISEKIPQAGAGAVPYRIYNIGRHQPVELTKLVEVLEKELGKKAERREVPMQPGDVVATFADIEDLQRDIGFTPRVSLEEGVKSFVRWYLSYYNEGSSA